uniref:Uncharacterized protein n=1 Tax=Anguilla anguilla TaxID=7936 RepID=A0A0E9X7J3_ANGAN
MVQEFSFKATYCKVILCAQMHLMHTCFSKKKTYIHFFCCVCVCLLGTVVPTCMSMNCEMFQCCGMSFVAQTTEGLFDFCM